MDKLESLLTENKRIYESGCGSEFNYSWVPSVVNKIYENYVNASIRLAPKIAKCQARATDKEFLQSVVTDSKTLEKHSRETSKVARDAKEVNQLGMQIMIIVLKKNKQPFETFNIVEEEQIEWTDSDYENYIGENMSTEDQASFISCICVGNKEDQKKK